MAQQKYCRQCSRKDRCGDIYTKLGNEKGPSILPKALQAFLLPMAVFILSLAASLHVLAKFLTSPEIRNVLALLPALSVTLISVPIIKAVASQLTRGNSRHKL